MRLRPWPARVNRSGARDTLLRKWSVPVLAELSAPTAPVLGAPPRPCPVSRRGHLRSPFATSRARTSCAARCCRPGHPRRSTGPRPAGGASSSAADLDGEDDLGARAAAPSADRACRAARRARAPARSRGRCPRAARPPMPVAVVGDREHDVAVAPAELDPHVVAAVLERVLQQLGEDERERGRARARRATPARARRVTSLPPPTPCTSIARSRSIRSASSTYHRGAGCEQLIHRCNGPDAVDRCSSASRGSIFRRPRLQAQQRRDGLQVVLDAVVDLSRARRDHRAAMLQRDRRCVAIGRASRSPSP